MEPFRQESNTCYTRWLNAGKPRQGVLQEAKLLSHAFFKHAVCRVQRQQKLHQAQGLFGVAMAGDVSLFKEMRRIKTGEGQMEDMADTMD